MAPRAATSEPAPPSPGGDDYVLDNMEGAVDRAAFLARTNMPIAIVGARGTGKMYVARVVHAEAGYAEGALVAVDCRRFRNRDAAIEFVDAALRDCAGKTLVFKYPHLMAAEAQLRLARQLASRRLADSEPPMPVRGGRFVALFPDYLERLVRQQQLQTRLASVFAGYPIYVPPIRDRRRAVLRWAEKILQQECSDRGLEPVHLIPEAEQAMLAHPWEGNISEMRQRIVHALASGAREWLGPAELGLFSHDQDTPREPLVDGFGGGLGATGDHRPGSREALELRLAEAVHHVLAQGEEIPLGTWLEDAIVRCVLSACADQPARAARRLQTTSRNVSRWLPGIESRAQARRESLIWRPVQASVEDWVAQAADPEEGPLQTAQTLLLRQLELQGMDISVKNRAALLGVSPPTYNKRLKAIAGEKKEHP